MSSGNPPRKTTTLTLKVTNRRVARPPTPDLSDDEGYSALEELSDSDDDDDEDVNAAEEEHLMSLARAHTSRSPRPVSSEPEDADQDDDDDEDDDGDDEDEEANDEEDMYANDNDDEEEAESKSWNGFVTDNSDSDDEMDPLMATIEDHMPQSERHVRFDMPDSDSDSTDTDDDHADMFPDIFVDQATLDPAIRREIDRDPEESSGSNSFWDFTGGFEYSSAESDTEIFLPQIVATTAPPTDDDSTPMATPAPSQSGVNPVAEAATPTQAMDVPAELDGYESESLSPLQEPIRLAALDMRLGQIVRFYVEVCMVLMLDFLRSRWRYYRRRYPGTHSQEEVPATGACGRRLRLGLGLRPGHQVQAR
jgi:hypothetical protein